jgi:ABC-type phosphate/phosphonate transport system ATPase subunit
MFSSDIRIFDAICATLTLFQEDNLIFASPMSTAVATGVISYHSTTSLFFRLFAYKFMAMQRLLLR